MRSKLAIPFVMAACACACLASSVFDTEPFPSTNYPYRVHEQSSIVASGALERAEASYIVFTGTTPEYAVRWDRPYNSYTRTLYAKYNLAHALSEYGQNNRLPWLDRKMANASQPYYTSTNQISYFTDVSNFLERVGSSDAWFPTTATEPELKRMQLAVDATGLQGFSVLTNLAWNSAPDFWFKEMGTSLRVVTNLIVTLPYSSNKIDTVVPRTITVGELTEAPTPAGAEPYDPIPSWWIPSVSWLSDTAPNIGTADLDWESGTQFEWTNWNVETVNTKLAPSREEAPGSFHAPVYGETGPSNVINKTDTRFYVMPGHYTNGTDPASLIFSSGYFLSPVYGATANSSRVCVDWDRAPIADGYYVWDSELNISVWVPGQDTLSANFNGSEGYDDLPWYNTTLPITISNTVTPYRDNDMSFTYEIPYSAHQWIKYRTPPAKWYAENWGQTTWDYDDALRDLPLDTWVITDEGATFNGLIGSNTTAGLIESWRTISRRLQLIRKPTMSSGQEPVMDMYNRTSAESPQLVVVGSQGQSWDTIWELLQNDNYPTNFEGLGYVIFSPTNRASFRWSIEPSGKLTCHYDPDYVFAGKWDEVVYPESLRKTYLISSNTASISDSETTYSNVVVGTKAIDDISIIVTETNASEIEWVSKSIVVYAIENQGGTKYRSPGITNIFWGGNNQDILVKSPNNVTTCGIYYERTVPYARGYFEGVIPAAGFVTEWNGAADPGYPTASNDYYTVTNAYITGFTNCTVTTYELLAGYHSVTSGYWKLGEDDGGPSYCVGDDVVEDLVAEPTFGWTVSWTNERYAHQFTNSVTNTVEETVTNGEVVWTNTYYYNLVSGSVGKWFGSRWLPTGGQYQPTTNFAYPEFYNVDIWQETATLTVTNEYEPNSRTGKAENVYMDYQWTVTLDYNVNGRSTLTNGADSLVHDYFTDPFNVLRWDEADGFLVK